MRRSCWCCHTHCSGSMLSRTAIVSPSARAQPRSDAATIRNSCQQLEKHRHGVGDPPRNDLAEHQHAANGNRYCQSKRDDRCRQRSHDQREDAVDRVWRRLDAVVRNGRRGVEVAEVEDGAGEEGQTAEDDRRQCRDKHHHRDDAEEEHRDCRRHAADQAENAVPTRQLRLAHAMLCGC